jgi:hypothetical protein
MNAPPLERFYDLSALSEAGYDVTIGARSDELERLARWEDVPEVTRFEGRIALRRLSQSRFSYEALLEADVVQECVVTLAPVESRIARRFTRILHLMPKFHRHADQGGAVTLAAADDDAPEEIESPRYDLAGPLLEEFSLAIDPYPRAPGVEFRAPEDGREQPESPFAVLERFKPRG